LGDINDKGLGNPRPLIVKKSAAGAAAAARFILADFGGVGIFGHFRLLSGMDKKRVIF